MWGQAHCAVLCPGVERQCRGVVGGHGRMGNVKEEASTWEAQGGLARP